MHSEEKQSNPSNPPKAPVEVSLTKAAPQQEPITSGSKVGSTSSKKTVAVAPAPAPIEPTPEEEDDLTVPVPPGTVCKRKGCGVTFVSDGESRIGDGPGTVCTHHPAPVSSILSHSHLFRFILYIACICERFSLFSEKEAR